MTDILSKIASRYRYSLIILKQLVVTDFKLRYKGSVLGYVWTLLKPLALFAVMYVVFVHFLRFGADVPHFTVYLLLGIVLWNYFTEVTMNGMSAIVGKGDLMRKLYFPRYVVVLAGSFSALINLVINLVVVGVFMAVDGVQLSWSALLIVPIIIELFVISLALAFALAALYVRFRDINYIWEVVLQAGFYATPIFYPLSLVINNASEAIAKTMLLNPVAQIIQDARWALVTKDTATVWKMFDVQSVYPYIPFACILVIVTLSVVYFRQRSPYFAEEI